MQKGLSIGIISILILSITSFSGLVFADTNSTFIPNWVKGVAGWWAEGKISDSDFQQAIQFLVDTRVIHVNNVTSVISSLQQTATITFGESNSTQTISFQESNSTQLPSLQIASSVSQFFTLDDLKDSAMNWSSGKSSDATYFADVQKAIDSGLIAPFSGSQTMVGKCTDPSILDNIKFSTSQMLGNVAVPNDSLYRDQLNTLYQCGFVNNP